MDRLIIEVTTTDHGFDARVPNCAALPHGYFGPTIPAALRRLGTALVSFRQSADYNQIFAALSADQATTPVVPSPYIKG